MKNSLCITTKFSNTIQEPRHSIKTSISNYTGTQFITLLLIHHFFLIMSAHQFHHHHSHHPSLLHSFIPTSKHFFSINPFIHRPLVPSGLTSQITGLFIGFFYAQRFSFCFSFSSLVSHLFLFFSYFLNPGSHHSHYLIFLGKSDSFSIFSFYVLD